MTNGNNGRTHEPGLREVTSQLDDLQELMMAKIEAVEKEITGNDRRYEERFEAMDAKTGLALASSKDAVVKAEVATEKRFDSVNEFRETLRDQATTLLPREEAAARFKSMEEKVDQIKKDVEGLRESRSAASASDLTKEKGSSTNLTVLMMVIVGLFGVASLVVSIIALFRR
jgi:hypothetical protein